MAVYDPALMMQGDSWGATLYMFIKSIFAVGLWGMAVVGYLNMRLAWWERIWAFAAGVALILALPISDEIGYALGVLLIAQHLWRTRRVTAAAA